MRSSLIGWIFVLTAAAPAQTWVTGFDGADLFTVFS
jgi:hypothetical protein